MHHINTKKMPSSQQELPELPDKDQVMFIQFSQEMESLGILVADFELPVQPSASVNFTL